MRHRHSLEASLSIAEDENSPSCEPRPHVYLDNVMQANRLFATSEDAFHWLRRKVDDAAFDNRIAMLCKRHSLRRPSPRRAAA